MSHGINVALRGVALSLTACLSGCMAIPLVATGATMVGANSSISTDEQTYSTPTFPDELGAVIRGKNRLVLMSSGGPEVEAGRLLEAAGYVVTIDQSQGNVAQQTQSGRVEALLNACGRGRGASGAVAVRLVELKDESGLRMFIAQRAGTMSVAVDVLNCKSQKVSSFSGSQKISGGAFQASNFDPNKMAGEFGANRLIALSR